MIEKFSIWFLLILITEVSEAKLPVERSYFKLTTSNGLIVSVYNEKADHIDYVYPHIFARIDSGKYVHPFMGNISLRGNYKPISTRYLKNTHVITCTYKDFTIYYLASFTRQDKIFYIIIRGKKERISSLDFTEQTGEGTIVNGIDHLENSLEDLPVKIHGQAIKGVYLRPYKKDIYEKYFLYSFTDSLHPDKNVVNRAIQELNQSKASLVDMELTYMRNNITKCKMPAGLTPQEKNVVEQSVSVLKMSQVSDKEIFPFSPGQIMGSLRPGLWHIAWVRDGSFAIEAMTKLGMYQEAKKGLEFMLNAPANRYKHYIYKGKDYGPGMDYQISLTAYHGNGTEDVDENSEGINIEYDNFGLFLKAFCHYVQQSGDKDFYKKWNEVVTKRVADVILNVIAKNNLIKADSGPWEHHLSLVKQYTFTSGVNARGLEMFAQMQRSYGLPYEKYGNASTALKGAILQHMLVDNSYFKGNADDFDTNSHEYWDGGTFEIFANGLINDKSLFASHMQAYDTTMRIEGPRDGYIRLRSSDPYENQEWVFMNLRIALSHILLGDKQRGYKMLNYITSQAAVNYNVLPEMISNKKQAQKIGPEFYKTEIWCNCVRNEDDLYIGMIPMVGYGAGAYVLSLFAYYNN